MGVVNRVVVCLPEIDDAREARARCDEARLALGVAVLGEDEAAGGSRAPAPARARRPGRRAKSG
jgi:hypothetical protein